MNYNLILSNLGSSRKILSYSRQPSRLRFYSIVPLKSKQSSIFHWNLLHIIDEYCSILALAISRKVNELCLVTEWSRLIFVLGRQLRADVAVKSDTLFNTFVFHAIVYILKAQTVSGWRCRACLLWLISRPGVIATVVNGELGTCANIIRGFRVYYVCCFQSSLISLAWCRVNK